MLALPRLRRVTICGSDRTAVTRPRAQRLRQANNRPARSVLPAPPRRQSPGQVATDRARFV